MSTAPAGPASRLAGAPRSRVRAGRAPRLAAAVAAAVLAVAMAAPAAAQLRAFEFQLDNDQFAFTSPDEERWYTSGEFLRFAFDAQPGDADARFAAAWCTHVIGCDPGSRTARVLTIGQAIFTPRFPGTPAPQPLDRPYAAALYGGLAAVVHGPRTRQTFGLRLGAVGPAALGEPVQNTLHTLLGQQEVVGWGWQVRAQPLVQLDWSRLSRHATASRDLEWVTRTAVSLGTPVTEAGVGALLRFGRLPAGPAWPGEMVLPQAGAAGAWHLYAGAELRAVARNRLVDGDTYHYVSQVRREPWGADLLLGGTFALTTDWQLDLGFALRSVEFSAPSEPVGLRPQRFGTLTLRWAPPR
jgi:lipid A 3-O-deacylase